MSDYDAYRVVALIVEPLARRDSHLYCVPLFAISWCEKPVATDKRLRCYVLRVFFFFTFAQRFSFSSTQRRAYISLFMLRKLIFFRQSALKRVAATRKSAFVVSSLIVAQVSIAKFSSKLRARFVGAETLRRETVRCLEKYEPKQIDAIKNSMSDGISSSCETEEKRNMLNERSLIACCCCLSCGEL